MGAFGSRPAGFTLAVIVTAVEPAVPLDGDTLSQLGNPGKPLPLTDAAAEKLTLEVAVKLKLLAVHVMGLVLVPRLHEMAREEGLAVSVSAVIVSLTCTETVLFCVSLKVTVPEYGVALAASDPGFALMVTVTPAAVAALFDGETESQPLPLV